MRYECPSCKMHWTDDLKPSNQLSHPLCVFCSTTHTQKELLNWQMDHLEDIDSKFFPLILKYFFRYIDNQLKFLNDKFYEERKKINKEDNS